MLLRPKDLHPLCHKDGPLTVTTRAIRLHLRRYYNFYNRFAILLQVLCGLPSLGRARLTRMLCAAVNEKLR